DDREHRGRPAGHRHRRAAAGGDRRRKPSASRAGGRSPARTAPPSSKGGDRTRGTGGRHGRQPGTPEPDREVGMHRRKLGLAGLVAGGALIASLTVALTAGATTKKGYKIFFLPKTTTIPV